jgi:hypothetical protein
LNLFGRPIAATGVATLGAVAVAAVSACVYAALLFEQLPSAQGLGSRVVRTQ